MHPPDLSARDDDAAVKSIPGEIFAKRCSSPDEPSAPSFAIGHAVGTSSRVALRRGPRSQCSLRKEKTGARGDARKLTLVSVSVQRTVQLFNEIGL